jgi:hypothetical protein
MIGAGGALKAFARYGIRVKCCEDPVHHLNTIRVAEAQMVGRSPSI